jgi:hypothetical protein
MAKTPRQNPLSFSATELLDRLQQYNRDYIDQGMVKADALAASLVDLVEEEVASRLIVEQQMLRTVIEVMEPFVQTMLQFSDVVDHASNQLDAISNIVAEQITGPYKDLVASIEERDPKPEPQSKPQPIPQPATDRPTSLIDLLANINRLRDETD